MPAPVVLALRVLLTTAALLAVAQPVLAGGYLDGSYDLVIVHRWTGVALLPVTVAATAVAAAHRWAGRGGDVFLTGTAALVVAVTVQLGMGFTRQLVPHLPLGVAVVAGTCWLAWLAWTPAATGPRRS